MPQLKKYSWRELPVKVLKRLKRMVYYKQTIIVLSMPSVLSTGKSEIKVRDHHQHPEIIALLKQTYPQHIKVIDQRLRQGLLFVAVTDIEEKLLASCWFALERFIDPIGHFEIPVDSHEAYATDGKVEPKYRRSRYGTDLFLLGLNYLWHMDRRIIISAVNIQNLPAVKFHFHMGFKEIGRKIETLYVFGRPFNKYINYVPEAAAPQVSSSL
jgi:GNAT superfamily N-acetyltransferase